MHSTNSLDRCLTAGAVAAGEQHTGAGTRERMRRLIPKTAHTGDDGKATDMGLNVGGIQGGIEISPSKVKNDSMTAYIFMVTQSSEKKRALILAAAEQLFLRYGIRRTSIDDVAREAGIAKGTIYLYYDSKESLNAAVVEKFCAQIIADGRRALATPGPLVQRLVAFLDAWKGKPSRLMDSSPHTIEIIESTATVSAAITAAFYVRMRALLAETLREDGIVNDDAVTMLFAAAVGTLETGEIAAGPYKMRLALMVKALIAGLRTEQVLPKHL